MEKEKGEQQMENKENAMKKAKYTQRKKKTVNTILFMPYGFLVYRLRLCATLINRHVHIHRPKTK